MAKTQNNIEELPLVSVSTITYNHKDFIAKCIEGVLSQKTNFRIEYLIHDDCSTDGTTEIVRQYAEKYPDIIKPMYEQENQYSKGGPWGSIVYNYPRARGKYIALCEGDDFWTDPYKLKKQVDFMESHPDYSCCFHRYVNKNIHNNKEVSDGCDVVFEGQQYDETGIDISIETSLKHWVLMPLTMLFRKSQLDFSLVYQYKYYRDVHENYYLMRNGKCRLMAFRGAVRNMHSDSMESMRSPKEQCSKALLVTKELYEHNIKDIDVKRLYFSMLQWSVRVVKMNCFKKFKSIILLFLYDKNMKTLIKNIKYIS